MTERSASPPTARVVRLLEHLAQQPHEPRTVTQLARELGMPRATCALIVEELAGLESQKSDPVSLAVTLFNRRMAPYPEGHPLATLTVDELVEVVRTI